MLFHFDDADTSAYSWHKDVLHVQAYKHCCVVTLLLHCCHNVATLLLHCSYTALTWLLH
jgi:hypothetical protein